MLALEFCCCFVVVVVVYGGGGGGGGGGLGGGEFNYINGYSVSKLSRTHHAD